MTTPQPAETAAAPAVANPVTTANTSLWTAIPEESGDVTPPSPSVSTPSSAAPQVAVPAAVPAPTVTTPTNTAPAQYTHEVPWKGIPGTEEQGILYQLSLYGGSKGHPVDKGFVNVTASSTVLAQCKQVVAGQMNSTPFASEDCAYSWVRFDFSGLRIVPTHYSLRVTQPDPDILPISTSVASSSEEVPAPAAEESTATPATNAAEGATAAPADVPATETEATEPKSRSLPYLRSWQLQASNDCENWSVVREHVNDETLTAETPVSVWNIDVDDDHKMQSYRYFQLVINKNGNTAGTNILCFTSFEIFGVYHFTDAGHIKSRLNPGAKEFRPSSVKSASQATQGTVVHIIPPYGLIRVDGATQLWLVFEFKDVVAASTGSPTQSKQKPKVGDQVAFTVAPEPRSAQLSRAENVSVVRRKLATDPKQHSPPANIIQALKQVQQKRPANLTPPTPQALGASVNALNAAALGAAGVAGGLTNEAKTIALQQQLLLHNGVNNAMNPQLAMLHQQQLQWFNMQKNMASLSPLAAGLAAGVTPQQAMLYNAYLRNMQYALQNMPLGVHNNLLQHPNPNLLQAQQALLAINMASNAKQVAAAAAANPALLNQLQSNQQSVMAAFAGLGAQGLAAGGVGGLGVPPNSPVTVSPSLSSSAAAASVQQLLNMGAPAMPSANPGVDHTSLFGGDLSSASGSMQQSNILSMTEGLNTAAAAAHTDSFVDDTLFRDLMGITGRKSTPTTVVDIDPNAWNASEQNAPSLPSIDFGSLLGTTAWDLEVATSNLE